jgi:hypothetical protein
VAWRAAHRCEYCLIHEDAAGFPHQADHIVSRKHGGSSTRTTWRMPVWSAIGIRGVTLLQSTRALERLFGSLIPAVIAGRTISVLTVR